MGIAINFPSPDGASDDPWARAREFAAAWYTRWGGFERLSDVPLEPKWLLPWSEDLGIFELVDYGTDFRLRSAFRIVVRQIEFTTKRLGPAFDHSTKRSRASGQSISEL